MSSRALHRDRQGNRLPEPVGLYPLVGEDLLSGARRPRRRPAPRGA